MIKTFCMNAHILAVNKSQAVARKSTLRTLFNQKPPTSTAQLQAGNIQLKLIIGIAIEYHNYTATTSAATIQKDTKKCINFLHIKHNRINNLSWNNGIRV